MKGKRGISLIVLIITIVVMIILAAAIILTLSGNGIISNAKDATDKSDKATLKEAATVLYSEWITEYAKGETDDSAWQYVTDGLRALKYTETQINSVQISDEGIVSIVSPQASILAEKNVPIGAKVEGYSLASNKTTSYTTATAVSYGNKWTLQRGDTSGIVWKYMGTDDEGNVLIMSSGHGLPIMALGGPDGYLNGPTELNKACEALYSSNMGKARNANLEDMLALIKPEGPLYSHRDVNSPYEMVKHAQPITISEAASIYGYGTKMLIGKGLDSNGKNADSKIDYIFMGPDDIGVTTAETRLAFDESFNKPFWLASNCYRYEAERYTGGQVNYSYGVRYMGWGDGINSEFDGCFLSSEHTAMYVEGTLFVSESAYHYIRPVVVLSEDVTFSYDAGSETLKISL